MLSIVNTAVRKAVEPARKSVQSVREGGRHPREDIGWRLQAKANFS